MNLEIFRAYDIRGSTEGDLTAEVVRRLGWAIGAFFRRKGCSSLVIGRDARPSSDWLFDALVQGLAGSGLAVTDVGLCPTPALYFASIHFAADAAVMITGSHNPPEYNGFKLVLRQQAVYGEAIQEIREIVQSEFRMGGQGRLAKAEILDEYCQALGERLSPVGRPIRVVVDSGNGTGGLVAGRVYREMGCDVIPLFCEVDGRFPNHHPDPTVAENLHALIEKVRSEGADLGIAFDGDADRLGAVDETGTILWGDDLLILFSRAVLEEYPGTRIIGDVKCSDRLFKEVRAMGGIPIMWKSGHSLIKAKMREENALLAGEWSAHFCFADRFFGFDDGIYSGGRLIEICARSDRNLSGLLQGSKSCATPEFRMDCPDQLKFEVVRTLSEFFSARYDTITLDGVRVNFEDGWALIRASNTQPVLVTRFEAGTTDRRDEIRALVEGKLAEVINSLKSGDA